MGRTLIALALGLALAAPASAAAPWSSLTQEARSKAEMLASVVMAKDICSRYQFDDYHTAIIISLLYPNADVRSNEFLSHSVWFLTSLQEAVQVLGEDRFCDDLYSLFGPDAPIAKLTAPGMTRRVKK
jgi:hypothetical protein